MEGYMDFMAHMRETLGWSPLHCTVEKENILLSKKLINEGANVNAIDTFGRTPLTLAASKCNLDLIELLTAEGAEVNRGFPLHYSCEKGHTDSILTLIKKGADVNLRKDDNNYPILIAAAGGHLAAVKILVEYGADVHVVDGDKETALHCACDNGNSALIQFTIDAGCDINARDKFNMSPLSICLVRKETQPELARILLEKGASVNLPDRFQSTCLHECEHPDAALDLISHGADVNALNDEKETPLHILTFYEYFDCAEVLLEHDANPNIVAPGGWAPLHLAVDKGNLDYVETLLKHNADVNVSSALNVIPLHIAAKNGHLEIVKKLLDSGSFIDVPVLGIADINRNCSYLTGKKIISEGATPLSLAASNNHVDVCKLLIERGARIQEEATSADKKIVDWPCNNIIEAVRCNALDKIKILPLDSLQVKDLIGWTPLHHSAAQGFYEMASLLLEKNVAINAIDTYERTPLSIVAAKNDLKMMQLFLGHGADVNLGLPLHYAVDNDATDCLLELIKHSCDINIKNKKYSRSSALIEAASDCKRDIVKILLENNADTHCTNKWGETALHQACQFSDVESVRALVEKGADVNALDDYKDTPLTYAAVHNNVEIIKLLLNNNADVNVKDGSGWTALHRAAWGCEDGIVELLKAGAPVNTCNGEGETALFLAAHKPAIVRTLIDNNADVNLQCYGGWSPLHESVDEGNIECVKELLDHNAKINCASAENVLPIYLAAIFGNVEIVEELLNRGSYVDPVILDTGIIRDDSGVSPLRTRYHIVPGNTPLIGAACKGHLEVVKLMCSHGARLDIANSLGETALDAAVASNHKTIVEYLGELNNVKNKK